MFRRSRTLLLILGAGLLALSPVRAQEVLYVASGSGGIAGSLYRVDPATAVTTLIGPITNASAGGAIGLTGLAFNPVNGKLYGITGNKVPPSGGNTVQSSLVTINTVTAVATVIGSLGFANSDISFRSDGTLYGFEAGGNTGGTRSMTTINLTTGAATKVGTALPSGSLTFGGGLAFSPSGTLYLSATGLQGSLDTLDPTTGARSPATPMSGAPFQTGVLNAMDFNANGTLFAINQSSSTNDNYLVMINLVNGVVTQIGPTPSNLPTNIDAMAFDPGTRKQFRIISKVDSTATLTIDSLPGYTYQLQRSNTLLPGTFTNIGSSQSGTGGTLTFTDSTATSPAAFYRVLIGHLPGANQGPLKPGRLPANLDRLKQ